VNAFLSGGFIPPALHGQRRDGYLHVCDWYATLLPVSQWSLGCCPGIYLLNSAFNGCCWVSLPTAAGRRGRCR
jgi:hypothetical protein